MITLGLKSPFAKIALFLAFQIHHNVACQIKRKPLRIFALRAEPLSTSKREEIEGGITIATPIHLKISLHTNIALEQCKKR
jgi:hypothetical protein